MRGDKAGTGTSFGRRFWHEGLLRFGLPVATSATFIEELLDGHFSASDFLHQLVLALLIGAPIGALLWTILLTHMQPSAGEEDKKG